MTKPGLAHANVLGAFVLLALSLVVLAPACGGIQAAAGRDPMRCERDPNCTERADKSKDCITQCVDDPACMDRCCQITGQCR
jgi:hypothetical protein